jgi:arginine decarboxylase
MFSSQQDKAPLLEMLKTLSISPNAAFYAPGHKKGKGIPQKFMNLLGKDVFRSDLPELPELDNLFAPEGVIAEAQQLAAELFGADRTYFLINGSTCGIIASILATCSVGDKIILPRNIHQSAISGTILAGAMPIFIQPESDRIQDLNWDLSYSIAPESLNIALQQHPDAKAVMLLYPNYQGVCGDINAIVSLTRKYDIPLIVDEAHGAHFAFHPDLPLAALSAEADISIQSTHKVLGAMTQASMLHLQGKRIDRARLEKALQSVQSTSPSYLLLASLDAARQQMAIEGRELMEKTLALAAKAREKIAIIDGLSVLEAPETMNSGFFDLDRTRLTVNVSQLGITGYEADEILHRELGVTVELPLLNCLTSIVSLGNSTQDIDRLIDAFTVLSARYYSTRTARSLKNRSFNLNLPNTKTALSPREAFFASKETIKLSDSIGRISAETICPYPPGIPALILGEIITSEILEYLKTISALGGVLTGCSDSSLETIEVIL